MKKIIYFTAQWCQPCKTFAPTMNEVQASGISVQKVDVDGNLELSRKYGIRSVPTCVFIKNNEIVRTLTGVQPKQTIINTYNSI